MRTREEELEVEISLLTETTFGQQQVIENIEAQRDEGLAREAAMRQAYAIVNGTAQEIASQLLGAQQRLAEAENLLSVARPGCHPKHIAMIDRFLASPGCADEAKE